MKWIDYIILALDRLDTSKPELHSLGEIYESVTVIRNNLHGNDSWKSDSWKSIVRRTMQNHCPSCEDYVQGNPHNFINPQRGYWGINSSINYLDHIPNNIKVKLSINPKKRKKEETKNKTTIRKYDEKTIITELSNDIDYIQKSNTCKITKTDYRNFELAHTTEIKTTSSQAGNYPRNPKWGKIAIERNNYNCLFNEKHETFKSQATNKNFLESHHLIPISEIFVYWENQRVNIDCVQNIVPLCPNCHRQVHLGTKAEKTKILRELLKKKKNDLKSINIEINMDTLLSLY